ncbi:MAG: hypothetical protein L6R41_001626 [Letrouitia leprolyta]|nr:MAG: hypothetical protein L6R41_001626 [Letrouitia leprolyta]
MHSLYFYTVLLITTALAASPHRRLISNRVAILRERSVTEMSSTVVAGMAANMTVTNTTMAANATGNAANATENAAGGNNAMDGQMNGGNGQDGTNGDGGMGGNNKMQGKHKKGGNKFKTAKMKDVNGNVVTVIIIA